MLYALAGRAPDGLTFRHYCRHAVWGVAMGALVFLSAILVSSSVSLLNFGYLVISSLLYPYARFVCERGVVFLLGDDAPFMNAPLVRCARPLAMLVCWLLAAFLGVLGLVHVYHLRQRPWG